MGKFGAGRGYTKHCFTVLDYSEATKRRPGTIRNDISRGDLDPGDIKSVAKYIIKHTTRSEDSDLEK